MSKCHGCGEAELAPGMTDLHEMRFGRRYRMQVPTENCPKCKDFTMTLDDLELFELSMARDLGLHAKPTGDMLYQVRKMVGLTRDEYADLIGVDTTTILTWESWGGGEEDIDTYLPPSVHLHFRVLGLIAEDRLKGHKMMEERLHEVQVQVVVDVEVRLAYPKEEGPAYDTNILINNMP